MRLYYELAKNALQMSMAYRFNTCLQLVSQTINMFILITIWRALYNGTGVTASNMGAITLQEMTTYSIISSGIYIFINNDIVITMGQKLKTGEIATDLIKPINLKAALFCKTLGEKVYQILFQLIPLMGMAAIFVGIPVPGWQTLLLFFITLINGMILYFSMTYIIGLIGFWYLSIWHLRQFLDDVLRLLSGSFIPLWFFPTALIDVSSFLPFRLIFFTPISIYLEKISGMEAGGLILQQLLWIIVLWVVEKILWRKGIRKLVIQGG